MVGNIRYIMVCPIFSLGDVESLFPRFQRSEEKAIVNQTILAADTCGNVLVSPPPAESRILSVNETMNTGIICNDSLHSTSLLSLLRNQSEATCIGIPKPLLRDASLLAGLEKSNSTCPSEGQHECNTPSAHNAASIDLDETCIPPYLGKENPKADQTVDCSIPSSPVLTRSNHLRNERKRVVVRFNETVNDGSPSLLSPPINSSNFRKLSLKQKKVVSHITMLLI